MSRSSRSGSGRRGFPRDTTYALSVIVVAVVAGVAALWWAYFDFTAVAAERALRRASPQARGPMARDVFTYSHYPVVLGIILYAVTAKKNTLASLDPLSEAGRWALSGSARDLPRGLRAHALPRRPPCRMGAARRCRALARGRRRARRGGRDRDARCRGASSSCSRSRWRPRGCASCEPRSEPDSGVLLRPSLNKTLSHACLQQLRKGASTMSEYRSQQSVSGWASGGIGLRGRRC